MIASGADVLDARDRRRQHQRARPARHERRLRRVCRTRTACCSSTRAACTGRRSAPAAWPASRGSKTPSLVARAVADRTDHHLLVGQGAQEFARKLGFEILPDLNTEASRKAWFEWKRRTDPLHYLKPEDRAIEIKKISLDIMRQFGVGPEHYYGTINCNGLGPEGRHLRRDDDERHGVEDPGARRRLADPRRRALRGRRRRRGGIDRPRRGQPLQPLARSSSSRTCGAACTRRTPPRGAQADRGEHRSRSGCSTRDGAPTSGWTSTC